jgi:4-amino-4-deoxy-L-arabinose transferase-like glycosyltransferase
VISKIYKTDKWLLWAALLASLLLSVWANVADDVINNDGVEYLNAAAAMLQGDWSSALQTYKWPFYSATIAFISAVSGLSLLSSAYLISAFFNAWLVIAFVALVRLLGGDRTTLWFALLVILAFPAVNALRANLIRDPAFMALFVSACYAFILYVKDGQKRHNVIAIAGFMLAALFRMEGLIYLLMTQAYLLSPRLIQRQHRFIGLLALTVLLVILVLFVSWWQFASTEDLSYSSLFTQPAQFLSVTWGQLAQDFEFRLSVIEEHILVGYSSSYAMLVLFWSAASIVFLELLHTLHYLYFILWLVAWRSGVLFPEARLYPAWRFLVLISLPALFGFVMLQWFLTSRYATPVAVLLLLATPFLLACWLKKLSSHRAQKALFGFLLVLIVMSGVKSLDMTTQKHYLREAANWMNENLPADASVYTNDRILAYYFEHEIHIGPYWPDWQYFMTDAVFAREGTQYGAINIKRANAEFVDAISTTLQRKVVAVFFNDKESQVIIFDFSRLADNNPPDRVYVK